MNTLFFDDHVYYPQGASKVTIHYDIDPDIDRECPFQEKIDPIVLEQAWNEMYPEDKGGFWNCYSDDRNAWSAWIIEWAKTNIFNQYSEQFDWKERFEKVKVKLEEAEKELQAARDMYASLFVKQGGMPMEVSQTKQQYGLVKGEVRESKINDASFVNNQYCRVRESNDNRKTA